MHSKPGIETSLQSCAARWQNPAHDLAIVGSMSAISGNIEGIEFFPDPDNAPGSPQYLNLWSGFAVVPETSPDWRKYKTFRDHLLQNVCGGDEQLFKWVFGFFAHMVQRPRERVRNCAGASRQKGTGKTKVGEISVWLFPSGCFSGRRSSPRHRAV